MSGPDFGGLSILVCDGCPEGPGAEASWLMDLGGEACPGATVRGVGRPCASPEALRGALTGRSGQALVMVACGRDEATATLRRLAGAAGVDPYGIAVAGPDTWQAGGEGERRARARRRLRALGRRALAYPGSHHDQVVLRLPGLEESVSRRGFLGLLRPRHRLVPRADPARCAAARGCRFCRGACPAGALTVTADGVKVSGVRCSGCAACVAACRFGALELPGWTTRELMEEVAGLSCREAGGGGGGEPDGRPALLVFACEAGCAGVGRLPAGVETVLLPCLDRLEPGLILRAAAEGLPVAVRGCRGGCARRCRLTAARRAVAFARQVLAAAARDTWVFWLADGGEPLPPGPAGGAAAEPGRRADGQAEGAPSLAALVAGLLRDVPDGPVRLAGGAVPFGWLTAAPGRCTLCGVCARCCPAGALRVGADGSGLALLFEHGRCVACGFCVRDCPEGALVLRRACEPAALAGEPVVLARGEEARCAACGQSLGPDPLRRRAAAAAGAAGAAAAADRLCPRCRLARELPALFPGPGRRPANASPAMPVPGETPSGRG